MILAPETLLILVGAALGLLGDWGLLLGSFLAFLTATLVAVDSPDRALLDGLPSGLLVLVPLCCAYFLWRRRTILRQSLWRDS